MRIRQLPAERTADSHPTDIAIEYPLQDSNRMARSRNSTRRRNSSVEPKFSLRTMSIMVVAFLFLTLFLVGMSKMKSRVRVSTDVRLFHNPKEIPEKILARFDAILILGGGVPLSLEEPPAYVQRRCDDAASVVQIRKIIEPTRLKKRTADSLPILCLSAGTAHLPQIMSADGLPIWESTASAAYLQKRYGLENVYVETTSFDTIGNAFYARSTHTDFAGWRRLLIVTNEFHMARTRAIFDWVFGVDGNSYQLYYLSSPNVGLSDEAIQARNDREQSSLKAVEGYAQSIRSMRAIWDFLNKKHDLYAAGALVKRGKTQTAPETTELVKKSYGGTR